MVEPGNKEELAAAIKKLWLDKEKYQEMKWNARNLITENFNKSTQFDRFISHFNQLISPI